MFGAVPFPDRRFKTVKSNRATRAFATVSAALAMFVLAACSDDPAATLPGPRLAQGGNAGCDLKDATKYARGYFPGNGNGSIKDQALDLIAEMEDACDPDAPDATSYTDDFFALAALIEQVLEDGTAGAPADGDALLWELIKSPERDAAFDPCRADASACASWDGFPTRPDFTGALSPDGTWAVVSTGTDAVCADHQSPCTGIDPDPLDPGTWGVEPSSSWDAALHDRTSVVFGNPLVAGSPTGETAYAGASGYAFNLIPHPDEFDPDNDDFLEVGLCSAAPSAQEALIQKGSTVLEQAFLSFCLSQSAEGERPETVWGRLAAFVGDLFDPRPQPLVATAFRLGPGGGAGSWSDFWAIDIPVDATIEFTQPPVDGHVGVPIKDAHGDPVTIRAITTSMASPIENVAVTISFEKNNGFLSSGDFPESDDGEVLTCTGGTCSGSTQADEEDAPGSLELPVIFTKPGAYRICVTGELEPLAFDTVCYGPFNIRP